MPGGGPMVAPGDGAGNIASARLMVSKALDGLMAALHSFPPGTEEYKSVLKSMSGLMPIFGKEQETGDAANRQFAALGANANPLAGSPSAGIMAAPMKPPAAAMGASQPMQGM